MNSSVEVFFNSNENVLISFNKTEQRDQFGRVLVKNRNKKLTESKTFNVTDG